MASEENILMLSVIADALENKKSMLEVVRYISDNRHDIEGVGSNVLDYIVGVASETDYFITDNSHGLYGQEYFSKTKEGELKYFKKIESVLLNKLVQLREELKKVESRGQTP